MSCSLDDRHVLRNGDGATVTAVPRRLAHTLDLEETAGATRSETGAEATVARCLRRARTRIGCAAVGHHGQIRRDVPGWVVGVGQLDEVIDHPGGRRIGV